MGMRPRGRPLRLRARAFRTRYWRPGTDFCREVLRAVRGIIRDGDFLAISEKAICTALGRLVDEVIRIEGY